MHREGDDSQVNSVVKRIVSLNLKIFGAGNLLINITLPLKKAEIKYQNLPLSPPPLYQIERGT